MCFVQRWCQLPLGTKYHFDSFGDSACTQFLASGTVETTGQEEGDYIEVKVLTNTSLNPEFIGKKYWIVEDAKKDGSQAYQLYTGAGTGGTGMYVKIYESAPTRNVSVTVQDSNEDAISGATVVIGETSKTTGSAGGCSFTLTDGAYEITVSKEDYTTKTEDISVAYDNTSITITLASA